VFFAIGSLTVYGDAAGRIKAVLPCSLRLWLSRLLGGLNVFAGCRKPSNECLVRSAKDDRRTLVSRMLATKSYANATCVPLRQ
jgi:hypothetical protein